MSLLQNALARVARKVQQEQLLRRQKPAIQAKLNGEPSAAPPRKDLRRVPKEKLRLIREAQSAIQRKRFQKFFEPLNMPLLRVFDDEPKLYDSKRAEANLVAKLRKDNTGLLNAYLNERSTFLKMLNFLVDSTPDYLKDEASVNDPDTLTRILDQENSEYLMNQYPDVPRYSFSEVPPIPHPLTKENFQKYIYTITHTKYPYRNSSSLTSGIIPEILLHTHHLENETYKPFRSAETYNYLIAYFGYNKFQNIFARGLLLVMAKDGHTPNIRTINELLKICRIHRRKRSLVSTYQVVINYLDLAKKMNLQINLTTWNRVYDCIDNIFFKEAFVNKMLTISLPILENMCIRILTDYCLTTKDTGEVITFIEKELRRPMWKKDPRLADRVIHHLILNAKNDTELQKAISTLFEEYAADSLSLVQAASALLRNKRVSSPSFHLVCLYLNQNQPVLPEVFISLIEGLCSDKNSLNIEKLAFILRGILQDASDSLKLPLETEPNIPETIEKEFPHFPYPIPRANMSERYRILKRLSVNLLTEFEAAVIHANHQFDLSIPMPWQPLSNEEITQWETFKSKIRSQKDVHENLIDLTKHLGLIPPREPISQDVILRYQRVNNISIGTSSDLRLLHKLDNGFEENLEKELKERGILKACT